MTEWARLYMKYGDEDLVVAKLLKDRSPRLSVYHSQQAVEKWLKACIAQKVNLDKKAAADQLVHDHDLKRLLFRVCSIYAPLFDMDAEQLMQQAVDLVQWPVRQRSLNHIRYPRFDGRQRTAAEWQISTADSRALARQAASFRQWISALQRY